MKKLALALLLLAAPVQAQSTCLPKSSAVLWLADFAGNSDCQRVDWIFGHEAWWCGGNYVLEPTSQKVRRGQLWSRIWFVWGGPVVNVAPVTGLLCDCATCEVKPWN